jgi:(2Fe-2S) ferredoxin
VHASAQQRLCRSRIARRISELRECRPGAAAWREGRRHRAARGLREPGDNRRRIAMADAGLVFVCDGCCCGHPERGGPKIAPRALRVAARRAFRRAGLDGRVRLVFTDCLGPCSEANVVFLYVHGRPLWLRRINSAEKIAAVLTCVAALAEGSADGVPAALAGWSFTWTGGGVGPTPPVDVPTD